MTNILIFTLSATSIHLNNQINIVTFIMFMCTLLSLWIFLLSNILWFSVLILLIYISGVMVLFIFIVSLSPNENAPINNYNWAMVLTLSTTFLSNIVIESENSNINSSIEISFFIIALVLCIICLMAYLPPNAINSFYSGINSAN